MKAIVRKFTLIPSSLTYVVTLFIKLNSANNTFTCFTRTTPRLLGDLNSPTIMWQENLTMVNEIDDQGKSVIV
jgi:hypothetical protein